MELLQSLYEIYPQFWKKNRLDTFENWPFQSDCSCTPDRMAAAGFTMIGSKDEPDLVECFICGKQLDDWNSDDDPWSEHVKHKPSCPYVVLGKQDELDWTIPDLYKLFKEYSKKSLKQKHEKAIAVMKKDTAELSKRIPKFQKKIRKSRKAAS